MIKELFYPIFILVTASCASMPLSRSLNTPVIEDIVCSILSMAN
jgi:hypothetical protein